METISPCKSNQKVVYIGDHTTFKTDLTVLSLSCNKTEHENAYSFYLLRYRSTISSSTRKLLKGRAFTYE